MRKSILLACAAFALAGCNRQQGGTSDQYGTERGTSSTMSSAPSTSATTDTNAFGAQKNLSDTNSQGGTTSQGGTGTGTSSSESKTNSSSNP